MDPLRLEIFAKVAELGWLSRAARGIRVSAAGVVRDMARTGKAIRLTAYASCAG